MDKVLCWITGHDHGSPQTIEEADNIACLLCRGTSSDPPNEIILCDNCGLGMSLIQNGDPLSLQLLLFCYPSM